MAKKIILVILVMYLAAVSVGCKSQLKGYTDIGKISFISANGFDIDPNQENEVINTIEYPVPNPASSSETGGAPKPINKVTSSSGKTIADAAQPTIASLSVLPEWNHCNYFIYGEEIAQMGIVPFLDVNFRYYDIRRSAYVFVTRNISAQDFIVKANSGEQSAGELLENLVDTSKTSSVVIPVTFDDLFEILHNPWRSAYIPLIVPSEAKNGKDSNNTNFTLSGYAVFKGNKLAGFMNKDEGIGLNWIIDKFDSGNVVIKDENGSNVYLEIYSKGSRLTPQISSDEKITVEIEIEVDSNLAEILAGSAKLDESNRAYMENELGDAVRKYVVSAINFAQKNNTDLFDVSGEIHRKYPKKWDEMKNNWDDIFPDLNFDIKINTVIHQSFDIEEPVLTPNVRKEG